MKKSLVILLFLKITAFTQLLPPVMAVQGDKGIEKIALTSLDIEVRICGHLAETRMTMAFYNPQDRAMAGDLYFPLPEGVTVSGYALDIDGVMVDGVVVTKDKARQVFEKEVRKGIDPGIVEWTKGNNFKTRVFPIPARGSRYVMVRYVSPLVEKGGSFLYQLPLNFEDEIRNFHIEIRVVRSEAQPQIPENPFTDLSFKKWESSWSAEHSLKNAVLDKNLMVAVPVQQTAPVIVEKDPAGDLWFILRDRPENISIEESTRPEKVCILWDASESRRGKDVNKEKELLQAWLSTFGRKKVEIMLQPFAETLREAQTFMVSGREGAAAELMAYLDKIIYDGGTQLSIVSDSPALQGADICLLFSDGLSTFGLDRPGHIQVPVYVINSAVSANHHLLRYIAMASGGAYFNMQKLEQAAIVNDIGRTVYSFISAEYKSSDLEDILPSMPVPVQGSFFMVGRLSGQTASIKLNYGIGGKVLHSVDYQVAAAGASEGDLLRRYWAQQKVDELLIFPDKNEEEIITLGKKFSIVTPGTSLIVLETLEQYIEHRIVPPETLPRMRKQYMSRISSQLEQQKREELKNLEDVLKRWKDLVAWWEKEFEFKKVETRRDKKGARGGDTGAAEPAAMAMADDDDGERDMLRVAVTEESESAADEESMEMAKKSAEKDDSRQQPPQAEIKMSAWDPDTPYLRKMKKESVDKQYKVYQEEKKGYGSSPAYYLDCADLLMRGGESNLSLRVLSTIAELELENPALLRVLAHRLAQLGELDFSIITFREVRKLRPEEPQSFRDLALVLSRRAALAWQQGDREAACEYYQEAVDMFIRIIVRRWDRFADIELIALIELNRIIPAAMEAGADIGELDKRFIKKLDCDLRLVMTWDADLTDMDVHIEEPSGEEAYYGHNRTLIGGRVSRDFTQGYGPEEYFIRRAMPGKYVVKTKYFSSSAVSLIGAVTLQLDIYTDYGRENEKKQSITIRLTEAKETFVVGEVSF